MTFCRMMEIVPADLSLLLTYSILATSTHHITFRIHDKKLVEDGKLLF